MDDDDWQRHCVEFEELLSLHWGRSLPPGASELHFALMRARMRATQAEIDKLLAEMSTLARDGDLKCGAGSDNAFHDIVTGRSRTAVNL